MVLYVFTIWKNQRYLKSLQLLIETSCGLFVVVVVVSRTFLGIFESQYRFHLHTLIVGKERHKKKNIKILTKILTGIVGLWAVLSLFCIFLTFYTKYTQNHFYK